MIELDAFEISGNCLLFLLVFGMSATVDINALLAQAKNIKAISTGIFLQFLILPLLGFLVVKVLYLNEAMGVTLLVVTSSPGGSYSNWWCSMFNADLALSVTMTAISTLLSIVMLPVNLYVYAKYSYDDDIVKNLDWLSLFISLVVVIGAISMGLFCSAKIHSHRFNMIANKLGNLAGISLVLFSLAMSHIGGGDSRIWNRNWKFYIGVAAPCTIGLVFANILTTISGLKRPERVTVSIECCYQNVGIATSVALAMFEGKDLSEAMGVPLFYGFIEGFILGIYCIVAWKINWTKAPSNLPFWNVIYLSYEVLTAETTELQEIEVSLSRCDSDIESVTKCGTTLFAYYDINDFDQGIKKSHQKKEPSGMNTITSTIGNMNNLLGRQYIDINQPKIVL